MEDDAVFVPLLVEYGILILLFIVCRRQLYESVALENLILLKRKYKRALLNERKKEIWNVYRYLQIQAYYMCI